MICDNMICYSHTNTQTYIYIYNIYISSILRKKVRKKEDVLYKAATVPSLTVTLNFIKIEN